MRRVILASAVSFEVALFGFLITACASLNIRTWYANPESFEYSVRLAGWPRSVITLEILDERPQPASLAVQAPNSPITGWDDHSEAVVNEIRRIFALALDGTGAASDEWKLTVKVVEFVVSFDAPNWVGSTVIEAVLSDSLKTTTRHWDGQEGGPRFLHGRDGGSPETAGLASNFCESS